MKERNSVDICLSRLSMFWLKNNCLGNKKNGWILFYNPNI